MRLPRLRLTLRRLMAAVGAVAVIIGLAAMWQRREHARQKAETYAAFEKERLEEVARRRADAVDLARRAEKAATEEDRRYWSRMAGRMARVADEQERLAGDMARKEQAYRGAMSRPWEAPPKEPRPGPPKEQLNTPQVVRAGEPDPVLVPPVLELLEPAPGSEYGPDQLISCVVRLTVPEGGRMPEVVHVAIKSGQIFCGSSFATPRERAGGDLTLEVSLDAPLRSGGYEVEAHAIQTLVFEPKDPSGRPRHETTRTYSPRVAIVVKEPLPASGP